MCKAKAQNRIDYIVLHKPSEAARIIEKYGYEPPREKEELTRAIRMLVKKKGEPVIKDLLRIHPEKELILEITGHKSDESNFCGCQSAYNEETKSLLDELSLLSQHDITQLYNEAMKKAKAHPEDKALVARMETIWDELNRRKKQVEKQEKKNEESSQGMWLKLGLAFLAGIVITKIA